jgi:hypothetical protein
MSKILEYRNDEVVQKTSQSMRENLEVGREIATKGEKESKTLKALTMVATMYLPASLLAVIHPFSPTPVSFSGYSKLLIYHVA